MFGQHSQGKGGRAPQTALRHGLMALVLIGVLACLAIIGALQTANAQVGSNRYSAIVMDAVTGEVFFSRSADRRLYPASMTKIMTLYLTFQALERGELRLNQALPVSRHADNQPPSHLALSSGSTIEVEDAIYALVTRSANDVSVVLAEAIGGTESGFAQMMTAQARRLGMDNTTFRNASGLPDTGQISTARDMARLAQAIWRDFPQYYGYFDTETWSYRGTSHRNHNRLLGTYAGMDGLKTGYIRASGFNLAASAVRGELRLVAVMFGGSTADERNRHVASILDNAFATERAQYLIVHGSMPFVPPLPGRRPWGGLMAQAEAEQLAALTASLVQTSAVATSFPALPVPDAGPVPSSMADVPLPVRPPVWLRSPATAALPLNGQPLEALIETYVFEQGSSGTEERAPPTALFEDGWGIQIGAFRTVDESRYAMTVAAQHAPTELTGSDPSIVEVTTVDGPLYRARFMGMDGQSAAAACNRIRAVGGQCVQIAPGSES
ncbi:MAG: D-alanyl-D-alanine carboxypeptidase [Pseudomonadota bacterium]